MFEKVTAARGPDHGPWPPLGWISASVAGHALLIAGASLVPLRAAGVPASVEEATYLVLHAPAERPPVAAPPRARPLAERRPRDAHPESARRPEEAPRVPVETAVPLPSAAVRTVAAAASLPALALARGVGVVGAVADSGAGPERSGAAAAGDAAPVVDLARLARPPRLVNRREVTRLLERLYPPRPRRGEAEGEVVAMFIVGTDGRVEMDSVRLTWASSPAFVEAARRGLARMRFRPAELDGVPVRVRATMPLRWVAGDER